MKTDRNKKPTHSIAINLWREAIIPFVDKNILTNFDTCIPCELSKFLTCGFKCVHEK
jgi:hypothetical protein